MSKKITIKNKYNDALYWATSKQSKGKDYQISRTEEAVLRKLIHYDKSNSKITYSNSIIAEHTFMGEESIKKTIPKLAKKRYISTATYKITDDGEVKTRRTIYMKWDFIETVLDDIPRPEEKKEDIASNEDGINSLEEMTFGANEEISTTPEVEVIPEVKEIINETVIPTDKNAEFNAFYEKCKADGRAEKKAKEVAEKNRIITFDEFAKDYEIIDEIVEILSPIPNLTPFIVAGKLKVNFNRSGLYASINSDDKEIKLPNIDNSYHPELFDIPKNINNLEYDKDWKPNKYLLEISENNIEHETILESSNHNDNDEDNDNLPW